MSGRAPSAYSGRALDWHGDFRDSRVMTRRGVEGSVETSLGRPINPRDLNALTLAAIVQA